MDTCNAILVVVGGLPGTGKTTIAREIAGRLGATYLRIDTIEQAIRSTLGLGKDVGPAGYAVAYAIGEDNLALGRSVVADCVNPLPVTRDAWRQVSRQFNSAILEVELICSDTTEHRRRVETRTTDIMGLPAPTWTDVIGRNYQPPSVPILQIDPAQVSAMEAAKLILDAVENCLAAKN